MTQMVMRAGAMTWALVGLMALHGAVHFLGAAKGFGLSEVPQLRAAVSTVGGVGWFAAGALMLVAAVLLVRTPGWWWAAALPAAALSQGMIFTTWSDARFGTVANVVILMAAVYALAAEGPWSFRSEYRREVQGRVGGRRAPEVVTAEEASRLPEPVGRYLEVVGAIGRPRPEHFAATWRGRIRAGPKDPWMEFQARQDNFSTGPARFFRMDAKRAGLPVDVLHVFALGEATMRVRLLSALQIVNQRGPELTRAETVTILNDFCLLAPGALVGPAFRWEAIDSRSARVFFTAGKNTVSAVLHFDDAGYLVDFVSDDRLAASADGRTFARRRWSTPIASYQSLEGVRVMRHGEGRWHPPGEFPFAYIELDLIDLEVDPSLADLTGGPRGSARESGR